MISGLIFDLLVDVSLIIFKHLCIYNYIYVYILLRAGLCMELYYTGRPEGAL